MIFTNFILLGVGLLLFGSVIFSKLSSRVGVPTLLIFLLIGLIFDAGGFIQPSVANYSFIQHISILALIIIMFDGGLDTDIESMRSIAPISISLASFGVLITAFVTGLLLHFILGADLLVCLLVGSIISSTDAAAVFGIFRTSKVKLKNKLDEILELESAVNDPTAYVLTTSFIYMVLHPATSVFSMVLVFIQSLVLGVVLGYVLGKLFSKLINNINLDVSGLYPVLLVSMALLTFAIAEFVHGNGFLAVYLVAVIVGNNLVKYKKAQISFFDGAAWLMQILLFFALGLFTLPDELLVGWSVSVIVGVILILVARPIAVFVSLAPFKKKVDFKSKVFLSWTGIKGAVPIVFAFYPLVSGVPGATSIFNVVFVVTIMSVLIQGSTITWLARKLNLVEN